jgi:hypothetical protein
MDRTRLAVRRPGQGRQWLELVLPSIIRLIRSACHPSRGSPGSCRPPESTATRSPGHRHGTLPVTLVPVSVTVPPWLTMPPPPPDAELPVILLPLTVSTPLPLIPALALAMPPPIPALPELSVGAVLPVTLVPEMVIVP